MKTYFDWIEKATNVPQDIFNKEWNQEVRDSFELFEAELKLTGKEYVTESITYWYDFENECVDYKWN